MLRLLIRDKRSNYHRARHSSRCSGEMHATHIHARHESPRPSNSRSLRRRALDSNNFGSLLGAVARKPSSNTHPSLVGVRGDVGVQSRGDLNAESGLNDVVPAVLRCMCSAWERGKTHVRRNFAQCFDRKKKRRLPAVCRCYTNSTRALWRWARLKF